MMSAKKILGILTLLFMGSAVYSAPAVDLKIVDYPETVSPKLVYQDLPVTIVVNSTFDGYDVSYSNLKVEVVAADNRILYQNQMYFGLVEGSQTYTVYIPNTIIESLPWKDGYVKVRVDLDVVFVNSTSGQYVEDLNNIDSVTIKLKNDVVPGDVDVKLLSPDIEKIKEFEKKVYPFIIGLKNDGTEAANKVTVVIEVRDQFDNRVYRFTNNLRLNPGEYREIRQDINFGTLKPGYYKLVFEVKSDDILVFRRMYNIIVSPENIVPIKIVSKEVVPPKYNKGDLVMIRFIVKNELPEEVSLNPEVISTDLNIYRKLSTFTLGPRETKEFRVVVPLDENLEPGKKEVYVRFWYGASKYVEKVYLEIPGETQKYSSKKILEVTAPSNVVVENRTAVDIYLKTFVEDLVPVILELSTQNVDAELEKTALIVGGEGLAKVVKLEINKVYGSEGVVTIKVYDSEGNLLDTKSIVVESPVTKQEPKEAITESGYNTKVLVWILVLALILAAAGYWYRKRRLEEVTE